MFGDQGVDELIETIEGHVVKRGPARLGLAVYIGVLGEQHLTDVGVTGLCRQVKS